MAAQLSNKSILTVHRACMQTDRRLTLPLWQILLLRWLTSAALSNEALGTASSGRLETLVAGAQWGPSSIEGVKTEGAAGR